MENVVYSVVGMSCSACAGHVKNALLSVPGVSEASVNITTNTATVSFDPAVVTFVDLSEAVDEEGYRLIEPVGTQNAV